MFEKSADKFIEQNTDRFISSYSNQKFSDYPAYPDYFIDCYERYCPDGCDVECPGSEEGFLPQILPKRVPGDVKSLIPTLPNPGNCPKKEKRVYMRAHIGELTEDEVKLIRDTSRADALIVFRQVEDIPRNTPEEEDEHTNLLLTFEAFKTADREGQSRQKRLQIATAMSVIKKAADFRKTRKRAWGYASIMGNVPGIPAEQGSNREDAAALAPVLKGLQMTNEKTNELLEKQNRLIKQGTAVNKKGFDALEPASHQSLKELQNIKTAVDKNTAINKKGFDALEPVSRQSLKELQNVKTAVGKNTAVTAKGVQYLKPVSHKSLAEQVEELPPLHYDKENEYWVSAKTLSKETGMVLSYLRTLRSRSETFTHKGLRYGRDNDGRIWCKRASVEGEKKSRKIFYLRSSFPGNG
jgi:hypothetical protein